MNQTNVDSDKPWLGLDPWGKGLIKGAWVNRPALARLLCRLEIGAGIAEVDVDFLVHKPLPDVLELWSEDEFDDARLLGRVEADHSIPAKRQYLDLLFQVFKAWRHYQGPRRLLEAGVLGERERLD